MGFLITIDKNSTHFEVLLHVHLAAYQRIRYVNPATAVVARGVVPSPPPPPLLSITIQCLRAYIYIVYEHIYYMLRRTVSVSFFFSFLHIYELSDDVRRCVRYVYTHSSGATLQWISYYRRRLSSRETLAGVETRGDLLTQQPRPYALAAGSPVGGRTSRGEDLPSPKTSRRRLGGASRGAALSGAKDAAQSLESCSDGSWIFVGPSGEYPYILVSLRGSRVSRARFYLRIPSYPTPSVEESADGKKI